MLKVHIDKKARKQYEIYPICPLCRGEIYWRSYNTVLTHEGERPIREEIVAHCENSSLAYRGIQQDRKLCEWRGKVSRSEDGDLIIMNFDDTPVPQRIYVTNLNQYGVDYDIRFVV